MDTIDVKGLSEKQTRLIQSLVESMKASITLHNTQPTIGTEKESYKVEFSAWPLGVKNKLTREEIYDHL